MVISNFLRLYGLTEDAVYLEQAEHAITALSVRLSSAPSAHSEMRLALDLFFQGPRKLSIVAPRGNRRAAEPLLEAVRNTYLPNRVLAVVCEREELDRGERIGTFFERKEG